MYLFDGMTNTGVCEAIVSGLCAYGKRDSVSVSVVENFLKV